MKYTNLLSLFITTCSILNISTTYSMEITREQKEVIQTIEQYQEVPFRASDKRLKSLENKVTILFQKNSPEERQLTNDIICIKIDKHIMALEEENPTIKKCLNALFFLANTCPSKRTKHRNNIQKYCLSRIQEAHPTCFYKLQDTSFEKAAYHYQLDLSQFNTRFIPSSYYDTNKKTSSDKSRLSSTMIIKKEIQKPIPVAMNQESLRIKLTMAILFIQKNDGSKIYEEALNFLINAEKNESLSQFPEIEYRFMVWKQTH